MEIRIGCSGWSYESWVPSFYPYFIKKTEYLDFYSKIFDTVEVDSTFYNIPDVAAVNYWKKHTPDNFRFTSKMPRSITHVSRLDIFEPELSNYLNSISYLGNKISMILIQLPPDFTFEEGSSKLRNFINSLPKKFNYAVEFRHNSWLNETIINFLTDQNITLVWSDTPFVIKFPILTTNRLYLRLIGDRSLPEDQFGKILRDKTFEIQDWIAKIKDKQDQIIEAYIFSNNHYQGFAPYTVNLFRKVMGMEAIDWHNKAGQRTLY